MPAIVTSLELGAFSLAMPQAVGWWSPTGRVSRSERNFKLAGSRAYLRRRKLVPATIAVCIPTDTKFGSRLEFANGDPGSMVPVPPLRIPLQCTSPVLPLAFSLPRSVHRTTQLSLSKPSPSLPSLLHL